jgi:hypothetical protein
MFPIINSNTWEGSYLRFQKVKDKINPGIISVDFSNKIRYYSYSHEELRERIWRRVQWAISE